MRLFKTHPVLAAALAVMLVAALGGGAYAFVDRVILSVDPDKSASDIERDVQTQLDNAGVPATARATKGSNSVAVDLEVTDPAAAQNVAVAVPDGGMGISVTRPLSDAETTELAAFEADVEKTLDESSLTGADLQTALTKLLAQHGFTQTSVVVTDTKIAITIR